MASVHAIKIIGAAWEAYTELLGCNPGPLRSGLVNTIGTELCTESAIVACLVYHYAIFTKGITEATRHWFNFR
jgi:hypothetical protein